MSQTTDSLRQIWCVAYDSDTPTMDGPPHVIRLGETASLEIAKANLRIVRERSHRAPKRNLRIETRMVTDWTKVETDA